MAFRTRRRRKPLVQWLPTFGIGGDVDSEAANGIRTEILLAGVSDEIRYDAVGVTFDYSDSSEWAQQQADHGARTLHDLVGGGSYRLRRIVGKIFAAWWPPGEGVTGTRPPAVDYAAGFIVCRTDDSGNPVTDFDEVNPLAQDSADDPWIWRRRWILSCTTPIAAGNSATITSNTEQYWGGLFPASTASYGSVADGPHIDQKTARVIDRQERLFFVQAARITGPDNDTVSATPGQIVSYLDYRLLGSVRPAPAGNRRNASR